MESSAQEALSIGANVFVFVIALTCGIMLMTTVLNMSEAANDVIVTDTNSTLMELYGDTKERVYTGEQMLSMFTNYVSETSNMKERFLLGVKYNNKIYIAEKLYRHNNRLKLLCSTVDNNSSQININIYMKGNATFAINNTYKLIYNGQKDGKSIYYFDRITD